MACRPVLRFPTERSPGFTQNGLEKESWPASVSSLGENVPLIPEVRGD